MRSFIRSSHTKYFKNFHFRQRIFGWFTLTLSQVLRFSFPFLKILARFYLASSFFLLRCGQVYWAVPVVLVICKVFFLLQGNAGENFSIKNCGSLRRDNVKTRRQTYLFSTAGLSSLRRAMSWLIPMGLW